MSAQTDQERFILLLREKRNIIYKICNSYCKSSEDRKDLAQEIIIQLWKSLQKYNDEYKLTTWVYAIALNVAMRFYRDKKRSKEIFPGTDGIVEIIEDTALREEQEMKLQLLYQFISKLDELNKALMILYLDNNSYNEIGKILGCKYSIQL